MKSLEVTPTIVALRSRVDEIKRAEVEKVMSRLGHLSAHDRELIEGLASSIVNKMIHSTMVTLKSEVTSSGGAAFVEAARRFFNLDPPPASDRAGEEMSLGPCLHTADRTGEDEPIAETVLPKRRP
jgi:glutamyl-tRNA reductase